MSKHSMLKAIKNNCSIGPSPLIKPTKQPSVTTRKLKILPKRFLTKLEITSLNQLRIYRKQGLFNKRSSAIFYICLQKTGIFNGFSDLMEYLFSHEEPNQNVFHSSIFKTIARKIKTKNFVSSLQIDLNYCDDFAFQFLQKLKPALTSLKTLRSLDISWRLSESTNTMCIPLFSKILENLRKLKSFSIDFRCSDLTYLHLESFTKALSKLNQLKKASLNLSSALPCFGPSCQEGAPINCIASALTSITAIEELEIDFSRNLLLTETSLEQMGEAFHKMNNLRKLHVCLNNTSIASETAFANLMASIHRIPSLKHLYLDLNSCFKNVRSLEVISKSIKNLKNIKTLNLFCDNWNPVSPECVDCFGKALENLTNLSELVLMLNGWTVMCKNNLEIICKAVTCLKQLEILAIDISHWSNDVSLPKLASKRLKRGDEIEEELGINDQTLLNMGNSLASLSNLKEIALYISDIKGVSGKGIYNIVKTLSNLKGLETLIITSENYEKIERIDFLNMGKYLYQYKNLKKAIFSFADCNISIQQLKEFSRILQPLEEKVKIEVYPEITEGLKY